MVIELEERRDPGAARAGRGKARALVAVAVPTALVAVHATAYGRWIVDDAAITFAYARSVATGAGPVLQPGAEPVEGFSNPAWLALLVAGRWLGAFDRGGWFGVPDHVLFPKLLALACCAAMFASFLAAARATTTRPLLVTMVAGAATAAVPSYVIWSASGLESSLLALVAVAIAAVLARAATAGRLLATTTAVTCGLLAALAALTRPDGLIYAAAYPLAVLVLLRRGDLRRAATAVAAGVAAFAGPAGLYLAWRLTTFGEVLPNTALAKSQGLPGVAGLVRPLELAGYLGWPAVLLAAAAVAAALLRRAPDRAGLVALLAPLGLAVAAYGVLEADWMGEHRFATPVWALGALVTAVAASRVLPPPNLAARWVVTVAVAAAVAVSGVHLVTAAREFRAAPTAPLCLVAQNTGHNVNGYARLLGVEDASLLAPDIGGAALVSELEIIDLAGLADARVAGFWGAQDWPGLRDHVFDDVRPTVIRSHGVWSATTGITADPRLAAGYVEVPTIAGSVDRVRRDAVGGPEQLARLRESASEVAAPAEARYRAAPLSSCGPELRPR